MRSIDPQRHDREVRMLEAQGLRKNYGERAAVSEVSLRVGRGEVLGLLGPNGAGKSTTVGMLCGLISPDGGRITLEGEALVGLDSPLKRRIGLVPQDLALVEELSARANLELFGALYGVRGTLLKQRIDAALDLVGLADRARDKPATFSGGMKRRLNIACALVHDPDLLLFDEPTVGVDPQSRNAIFDNLEALKRAGKALVYTTHYMEEAERLADRIVIVDHGRVVASGSVAELVRALPATQTLEIEGEGLPSPAALSTVAGVRKVDAAAGKLAIGVEDLLRDTPAVLQALAQVGAVVHRVKSMQANLEDVFLAHTGRQLRD
jgi:ABC-2 type transport system ATP-binding protein